MSDISIKVNGQAQTVAADQKPTHIFADQKEIVVCRVNGELKDLWTDLKDGDVVEGVSISSPDGLNVLRHSTAHVMAQAVQQVFAQTRLGIGPPIKDGFYYDFDPQSPFTPEDLEKHYQDEKEYQKLLNQEVGMNVMQFHNALVTAEYMSEWTAYVLDLSSLLMQDKLNSDAQIAHQFTAITNYIRGTCSNVLKRDRMFVNPEFEFDYDVQSWLNDPQEIPIEHFKLSTPTKVAFKLTEKQFKLVEDELDVHGDNSTGRGQVIKRVPINMLLRTPVIVN